MVRGKALFMVWVFLFTSLCIGGLGERAAVAQAKWPSRDITIIVPYNPGGGYDIKARLVAPLMAHYLPSKANVIVLNVPGAGGTIGLRQAASSKPDGYTLVVTDPVILATYAKLEKLGTLDPKTMTFLGQLEKTSCLMAVGKEGRFKSVEQMRGQQIRFPAVGDNELPSVALADALGSTANLIAYNGLPEGCMAVARGDIDAVIGTDNTLIRQVNALEGKLVPMMMIGGRYAKLPDLKTSTELGLNFDEEVGVHRICLAGPPSIPADVRQALEEVIKKATEDPQFHAGMEKAGYTAVPLDGAGLQPPVDKVFKLLERYGKLLPKGKL
jgi:tripartite-type tricarboxylate transporter receptor subunit TctC